MHPDINMDYLSCRRMGLDSVKAAVLQSGQPYRLAKLRVIKSGFMFHVKHYINIF